MIPAASVVECASDGIWVTFEDLAFRLSLEEYQKLVAKTMDAYDLREALRYWRPPERSAA